VRLTDPRSRTVLERVRRIPEGRVTTYGDLLPRRSRYAGSVLAAATEVGLPWHRVVRADGSLAKGERQRALLDAEGVPFRGARVDMRQAWVPVEG
jgi:alkylated DNA nucleotide flippase Atl1